MGCDSPETNFNTLTFYEGQWVCTWGLELSFVSREEVPLRRKMREMGLNMDDWNVYFDDRMRHMVWRGVRKDSSLPPGS